MVSLGDPFSIIRNALVQQVASGKVEFGLKPAAVLLLLVPETGGLSILFTKRTSRVEHHKGEVSFPGGANDPDDPDLLSTALRETHEEIGVPPDLVHVLGTLPPAATRSNFLIHPFVGALTRQVVYTPSSHEVEEVFCVPLHSLFDPRARREEHQSQNGQSITSYAYYHQAHRIWGATARVLTSFLDALAPIQEKERLWAASSPTSPR